MLVGGEPITHGLSGLRLIQMKYVKCKMIIQKKMLVLLGLARSHSKFKTSSINLLTPLYESHHSAPILCSIYWHLSMHWIGSRQKTSDGESRPVHPIDVLHSSSQQHRHHHRSSEPSWESESVFPFGCCESSETWQEIGTGRSKFNLKFKYNRRKTESVIGLFALSSVWNFIQSFIVTAVNCEEIYSDVF